MEDGRPINPNTVSSRFHALSQKLGLGICFHDLRHTHATMLLKLGIPPKIVAERLGHSTTRLTEDIYSHVLPGMQKEAARLLEEHLFGIKM